MHAYLCAEVGVYLARERLDGGTGELVCAGVPTHVF